MGWFSDTISGGRLKKIVYCVYGKIKKNVYLPSFSYSVLLSQTFFSDGLFHIFLAKTIIRRF